MIIRDLITIRKNHKNRKLQAQVVELCRSGIFSERQLLDELRISASADPTNFAISMKIYPIPSMESITEEVSTLQPSATLIEMVDLQGRVLQKADFKELASRRSQEFRTGDLAKSVYLIWVRSDNGTLTPKFVQ